jgi:hypothetical protein
MTPEQIRDADARWKARLSPTFDADASELYQLWMHQSRQPVLRFLETLQLGNKANGRPPAPSLVCRLVDQLSTLYRTPPARQLVRDGEPLPDDAPEVAAMGEAMRAARWDGVARKGEKIRTLLRQVVVVFAEHHGLRRVLPRLYAPHQIWRAPEASAADVLDRDEAIVLVRHVGQDRRGGEYEVWRREEAGDRDVWRVSVENGEGDRAGLAQPYEDTGGIVDMLPMVLWTDDELAGEPWLPIPQSRLDTVQTVNALLCDVEHLAELEAHTIKAFFGFLPSEVPTEIGPGKAIATQRTDARIEALEHKPQIVAALDVVRTTLSMLALAEGLSPNAFDREQTALTGPALQSANALIDARRIEQLTAAAEFERVSWARFAGLHNMHAARWGVPMLAADAEMRATFASPRVPVDAKSEQDVAFRDMQAGLMSPIDYVQLRTGLTRAEAIAFVERVRADRAAFGWTVETQPPGALVDGPSSALGPDSATLNRDATNLDVQSNNEQASAVGALGIDTGDLPMTVDDDSGAPTVG